MSGALLLCESVLGEDLKDSFSAMGWEVSEQEAFEAHPGTFVSTFSLLLAPGTERFRVTCRGRSVVARGGGLTIESDVARAASDLLFVAGRRRRAKAGEVCTEERRTPPPL